MLNLDCVGFVIACRFLDLQLKGNKVEMMSFRAISHITRLPIQKVAKICKLYREASNRSIQGPDEFENLAANILIQMNKKQSKQSSISENLRASITSQETLVKHSGKTLAERCVLIHRSHPEIKISSSALCQLYKKSNVKKKIIKLLKNPPANQLPKRQAALLNLQQGIANYLQLGFTVVFIDETMFTYNTVLSREYSAQNQNISYPQKTGKPTTIAFAAAISNTGGLEYFQLFNHSVNSEKFIEFCEALIGKVGAKDAVFVMDNLRVHHSKIVQGYLKAADIPVIFTPSYFPDSNPIEDFFSIVKRKYKREKLAAICNNLEIKQKELVRKTFKCCSDERVEELCLKGIERINKLKL